MKLPSPTPDGLAASEALQQHIANDIRDHDGWISFARYMDLVLYTPQLGYYMGGAEKLGKAGDFTTAPEMTPLFGGTLARACGLLMSQSSPHILEFGAGSGKLARDILTELADSSTPIKRYSIVELSGELRARQEILLTDFPQVEWLDSMPAQFSGVILANEVLDAMPVHLVTKTMHGWLERGITVNEFGFSFLDRCCEDINLLSHLINQIPDSASLPIGYVTELHPVASGFMRSLAEMMKAGYSSSGQGSAAILIDYGFPAHEYYLEQRDQGTLMCHYRHHAHPDPFFLPGLQDITAHVDFSSMAQQAVEGGLEVLAYMGQAAFLMAAGISELLLRTSPSNALHYLPQANLVQKLLSPAEMGELFKVLVVGLSSSLPAEFKQYDRSHRL